MVNFTTVFQGFNLVSGNAKLGHFLRNSTFKSFALNKCNTIPLYQSLSELYFKQPCNRRIFDGDFCLLFRADTLLNERTTLPQQVYL